MYRLLYHEDGSMSACIRFIDNPDGSLAIKMPASKACFVAKQTCNVAIRKRYKKIDKRFTKLSRPLIDQKNKVVYITNYFIIFLCNIMLLYSIFYGNNKIIRELKKN